MGFTLIEVLVVVALLAVLAGLSLVGLKYAGDRTAREKAESQLRLLELGLENYRVETGGYPDFGQVSGTGSQVIFRELFRLPGDEGRQVYLDELDPANDSQLWLGEGSGDLKIIDPWGNEYRYRTGDEAVNPDFDLWSAGPDGRTDPTTYPHKANAPPSGMDSANRDDLRLP